MSSRLSSKELFKWASYLGSRVAEITRVGKHNTKILKETSCMSKEYRMLVAYVEVAKLTVEKGDPDLEEIDGVIIPALQILGMAEWDKDTLTDLAMRVGTAEEIYGGRTEDVIDSRT